MTKLPSSRNHLFLAFEINVSGCHVHCFRREIITAHAPTYSYARFSRAFLTNGRSIFHSSIVAGNQDSFDAHRYRWYLKRIKMRLRRSAVFMRNQTCVRRGSVLECYMTSPLNSVTVFQLHVMIFATLGCQPVSLPPLLLLVSDQLLEHA